MLDDFNQERVGIEVNLSLPSARIIRSLERIIDWRRKLGAIRLDNGPEHLSQESQQGAQDRDIDLRFYSAG